MPGYRETAQQVLEERKKGRLIAGLFLLIIDIPEIYMSPFSYL